jgi:hypothetical protein
MCNITRKTLNVHVVNPGADGILDALEDLEEEGAAA